MRKVGKINSYTLTLCKNTNIQLLNEHLPGARPLVGAFLRSFRSRWNPIAPSKSKENPSTIDRPAINIYCRTGSKKRRAGARRGDVGVTGFEPATAWSQTRCATGLRYAPNSPAKLHFFFGLTKSGCPQSQISPKGGLLRRSGGGFSLRRIFCRYTRRQCLLP